MSSFDSLTWAFQDWFDTPMRDLPAALYERAKQEFLPMSWDGISGDQRRSLALQLDYQNDPSTKKDQEFWFSFFGRKRVLEERIAEWSLIATPTAGDLHMKEGRLKELRRDLARMNQLAKKKQGDYYPSRPAVPGDPKFIQYIPYPRAIGRLTERLSATPEELAAWVWFGPDAGGFAAYLNANELARPPRFFFSTGGDPDYVAALMACWFEEAAVANFKPAERFITGEALIKRWSECPALKPASFVLAKIKESRLNDLHPIYGGTIASNDDAADWPPLTSGLFARSQVEAIEAEDFDGGEQAARRRAKVNVGARSNKPPPVVMKGEIPPTQATLPVRLAARKLATRNLHKSWQVAYRRSKKKSPGKSDVWHAVQISRLPIADGRDAETIRKIMKQ